MQTITTIGLDIAKSVFQVHGVDANGDVVVRRQLKRRYVLAFFQKVPPCLVGIEACASAHYWSRELQALGHTVRLMPPAYVKPYVKRQKNDAADAEAICEAVTRPNMRFVPTKTPEQQSCLTLHRTRHLFIRQQTALINSIRAHLAEFGIVAPVGRNGVEQLLEVVADANDARLPEIARACVAALGTQLLALKAQILAFDRRIMAWHRSNETSKRLDAIPGVGPALATALVASVADPKAFRSGRDFSAWIGLVPTQNSSGGKDKLGNISKQGDRYLRSLFTAGALAVIRYAKIHGTKHRPWLTALLARRPTKVAAIALANKMARMAWAMMTRGERYKEPVALACRRATLPREQLPPQGDHGACGRIDDTPDQFGQLVECLPLFPADNPTFDIEVRTLRELCGIPTGIRRITDLRVQNRILAKMISVAPGERVPRHRLIRNLIELGQFEQAESEIRLFSKDFRERWTCS